MHPSEHPGVRATDITDRFAAAVKILKPGELVKDEHFTLFESVSALEIMDPKMDSGVLAEGESLDEEYDVSQELLPEEILGIIDQLLCLEMAWHLGYPLSQTLLTSVYVEALMNPRPMTIVQADFTWFTYDSTCRRPTFLFILRAYCIGLLKACSYVNEFVKEELYYEEEDFVTNTYDRCLLIDIPLADVTHLLQHARSELRALSNDVDKDVSLALDMRLELRMAFLRAMDLCSLRKANPDSLKMPWMQMSGLMGHIEKQHSLGKPVPAAFSTKLQRRLASTMPPRPIVQLSFEECDRHFKRLFEDGKEVTDILKYVDPQSLLTFVALFNAQKPQPLVFIRTLLQNLLIKEMVVLGNYSIRQILDHDLSVVVVPCGPQIDRSYDHIEVPTDPRHQTAAQMESFRQRVADAYLDLFRILCQSRPRLRRQLCHHIQEWDLVQADVEEIDQLLQINLEEKPVQTDRGEIGFSLPLSSWAYLYKLRQMEWIVQLGFELSIYQPDELAGMYWYLNYLAKTRAEHGDRIKSFTNHKFNEMTRKYAPPNGGKPQMPAPMEHEFRQSQAYIRATMLDAACTWEFADGLCCLYTVLQRWQLVRPAARTEEGEASPSSSSSHHDQQQQQEDPAAALRYEVRMKPFAQIGLPQLPAHEALRRATAQPATSCGALLRYADGAVGGARKGFEALARMSDTQAFSVNAHARWVGNVRGCLRAAIAAGVAVSTALKAWEKAEEEEDPELEWQGETLQGVELRCELPEPGKRYHDWWIVPKLTLG
ncbi:Mak10-domain-containing protein [Xylariaceae sp. FL0804]|nr:Mak10-domain-containing protein [Xylariaceae sp. FL0804]